MTSPLRLSNSADLLRTSLVALAAVVVAYLTLIAALPGLREHLPVWLQWFGRPGSSVTIAIAIVVIMAACWFSYSARREPGTTPLGAIAALVGISFVLAFGGYIPCSDDEHTSFFTALTWTINAVKGSIDDRFINGVMCPADTPVALEVTRLTTLSALLLGVGAIVVALLRSTVDRARLRFDRSITAVIGIDDDAAPLVSAVAQTIGRTRQLVVITTPGDEPRRRAIRSTGARLVEADFDRPDALRRLRIWSHVERLYLLSADTVANLQRLDAINEWVPRDRLRRPLIVRIDDPWQADAWRTRGLGGGDARWAAYATGQYEATAGLLLERVVSNDRAKRLIVCGTTPLTLALCDALLRRKLERALYAEEGQAPLPTMTIVGANAEEYHADHEFHQSQAGRLPADPWLDAVPVEPSVAALTPLLATAADPDADDAAVVFVDAAFGDHTLATRLAARFPRLPVYSWGPETRSAQPVSALVGQLRMYPLTLNGPVVDVWERAAIVNHQRYAALMVTPSESTKPWDELDEFYRNSNRRQIRNALWIVEHYGDHTWDTFGGYPDAPTSPVRGDADPLARLAAFGFDAASALAMAEAEHDDWRRYYVQAGWRVGPDDRPNRIHSGLVPWPQIAADPGALAKSLNSLVETLTTLRQLGYRSRPVWQWYARTGAVTAQRRTESWSWTSGSGQRMHGATGDWAVHDASGSTWSVRDDIFTHTYEHVAGNRWRRTGLVVARPSHDGETIQSLEGPHEGSDGAMVVQGTAGEQWVVDRDTFDRTYDGPLSPGDPRHRGGR